MKKADVWALGIITYEMFARLSTEVKSRLVSPNFTERAAKTGITPSFAVNSPEKKHLLTALLQDDPNKRATVADALKLAYFTRIGTPIKEPPCTSWKIIKIILNHLNIHHGFCDFKYNKCYCRQCFTSNLFVKESGDGKNIQKYVIPRGFGRIGLTVHPRYFDSLPVWKTWNKCYHGTQRNLIQNILSGSLGRAGDVTMDGFHIPVRNYAPGDINLEHQQKVYTSPSIKYASLERYATPFTVNYEGKNIITQIILEIRQHPPFDKGLETVGGFKDDSIGEMVEWSTSRRDCHVLTGLLIKLP